MMVYFAFIFNDIWVARFVCQNSSLGPKNTMALKYAVLLSNSSLDSSSFPEGLEFDGFGSP
jgi:hypothetical protein